MIVFFVLLLAIGLFVPMIDNYAIIVGTVLGIIDTLIVLCVRFKYDFIQMNFYGPSLV